MQPTATINNARQIEQAVTQFIKGGDNSDTRMLEAVLHPDFRVASHGFMGRPGVTIITRDEYIANVRAGIFGGMPRKMTIENVENLGRIANVTLWLESTLNDFVSYNSLVLDTDGKWKLIHNLAVVESRRNVR